MPSWKNGKKRKNKMEKKTNYPDLEKLPDHNHLKHFLNWLWNKPRWALEEVYEKYFLNTEIELEKTKLELQQKEIELTILKIKLEELKLNTLK